MPRNVSAPAHNGPYEGLGDQGAAFMTVVFLDCETTGIHRGYRAWEIAMIRRDPDGSEKAITIFVDQDDLDLANADPEALAIGGFAARHPGFGWNLDVGQVHIREAGAAQLVQDWTAGAKVFGINPSYDTICLDAMLARHGLPSTWFYVPQDISGIAYGFMCGRGIKAPRSSEPLSIACGVEPPSPQERHTAMGDALWVRRWYDKLPVDGQVSAA
jgi:hypothetical protein